MMMREDRQPKVDLSWVLQDDYDPRHTLKGDSESREQLLNTILMLIDMGHEIRIGTDGYALILEANDKYDGGGYQFVKEDEVVCTVGVNQETGEITYTEVDR